MIAYLNGKIKKKLVKSLILDTGGVGYLVYVTANFLEKSSEGQPLEMYIHTRVLEDDISLFGFENILELQFFKTMLSVNGIGAKTAMEILAHDQDKIKSAIISGDIEYLCKVPGIGKKTAERIIVELKNKVSITDIGRLHSTLTAETKVSEDAVNAIMTLGYQKFEISRVLKYLPAEIKELEAIVTYFLRNV